MSGRVVASAATASRCLVVVPCLNEREHIGGLLEQITAMMADRDGLIVVADGGSVDGTRNVVEEFARRHPKVRLHPNHRRIQSAGVNAAVARYGDEADLLIRIDAHGQYPDDYCQVLVEEAEATAADCVVVSMRTVGREVFQSAVAAVQNKRLGTGGSKHRIGGAGGWVDHGHHALMRIEAFRAVGGYDENFSHNEDAELDYRMRAAGRRIWLTGRTQMIYFPRRSPTSLFRQYFNYGRGRAQNMLKHRALPKARQVPPILVAPAVVTALLSPVSWLCAVPFVGWVAGCTLDALPSILRGRGRDGLLASWAAMLMHLGWSLGFWVRLLRVPMGKS